MVVTTRGAFFYGIYFNVLKFFGGGGVAELSEKQKRLHFCLRFTLQ
jgi:hypothetical protein